MTAATMQSPAGKVIGVIGGMGPEATVELMRQIIRRTQARDDADHVRMLVDNNPKVPSRIAFLLEGCAIDPTPTLIGMAQGLVSIGATVLAMPCNTAHAFASAIQSAVDVPFIDMIEAALGDIRAASGKARTRFGVLGSPALRRIGLFDARCRDSDLQPVYCDTTREAESLAVIRAVKAGDTGIETMKRYQAVKQTLLDGDVDAVLVCCTEFSVLEEKAETTPARQFDSMTSLVTRLL